MKNRAILSLLLPIVSFITLLLAPGCRKEQAEPDEAQCGLTYLERLHKPWQLALAVWQYGNEFQDTSPSDCQSDSCSFFNLVFEDSTYSMEYFLVREVDNDTLPPVAGKEEGSFHYESCHQENLNAEGGHYPGGFTNAGLLYFSPEGQEPYTTSFKSDLAYPLIITPLKISGAGNLEVYFKE